MKRLRVAAAVVTLFNRGAERMFGCTPDEVVGQPLAVLLPEASRALRTNATSTPLAPPT